MIRLILNDRSYTTYDENHKYTNVHSLEECFQAIRVRNNVNVKKIQYLEKENKKLKDEHFKDGVVQEMQQKLTKMEEDYYRGFPITEKEEELIDEWKKKHEEEVHGLKTRNQKLRASGAIGGRYHYIFAPTSIGTSGKIVCSCGEEFEFCEIG